MNSVNSDGSVRVLVLAQDYPNNEGGVSLMYIHSRNVYYRKQGIDVTVLNFSTEKNYEYDGITVISPSEYKRDKKVYDVLIAHAPNIKNHFRFINKYQQNFRRIFFYFHGHEILKISDNYPTPYPYMGDFNFFKKKIRDIYDIIKLKIIRNYFVNSANDITLIFVSDWMKNKFEENISLSTTRFNTYVIPNCVGEIFEAKKYEVKKSKKIYDFITIRSNIDGSKYCVDLVCDLARNNEQMQFLLIGKGEYFNHYELPSNIDFKNTTLKHEDIPFYLNQAKCALMPTRLDSQGVMVCEMATYGIPVITSNIEVGNEIASNLDNIFLIDNNDIDCDLETVLDDIQNHLGLLSNDKCRSAYTRQYTVDKEVQLIKKTEENDSGWHHSGKL